MCALALAILIACVRLLPAEERCDSEPNELAGITVTEHPNAQLPLDLELINEDGKPVRLGKYFETGRPVVLVLVYYGCPMLCGLVLNGVMDGMKGMPLTIGKDYDVVTVSFDPRETHTLARLKKQNYLKEYGRPEAARGWHFLTGKEQNTRKLADTVGFGYKFVESTQQYSHPACIFIVTPAGRVSRYLYGVQFAPKTLRLSLVEAAEGKVGSTVDRVLLLCFHYDPKAGTYSLGAMRIVQIVAILTLVVLGAVLTVFWMRESKRRAVSPRTATPEPGADPRTPNPDGGSGTTQP